MGCQFGGIPYFPLKLFNATFSSFLAAAISYPFAVKTRELVELWPKLNGQCRFEGNYRKAMVWLYYSDFYGSLFSGFYKNYFWNVFPSLFITVWLADSFGIFTYWYMDMFRSGATNTFEDAFS